MTVIMRFAALRPTPQRRPLLLDSGSSFQTELAGAIDRGDQQHADEMALSLRESGFVSDARRVEHGPELLALLARLRETGVPDHDDLARLLRDAVGADSPDAFAGDLARARDSVVAAYLLDDDASAGAALELVRAFEIATAALTGPVDRTEIETMLSGALALPEFLTQQAPGSTSTGSASPEAAARGLAEQINDLSARHDTLTAAIGELRLHGDDELEVSERGIRTRLSELYRSDRREAAERRGSDERRQPKDDAAGEPARSLLLRAAEERNLVFSAEALERMPGSVLETIRSLDLDPAVAGIAELRADLVKAQDATGMRLLKLSGEFARLSPDVRWPIIDFVNPRWILDPVDAPDTAPPIAVAAPGAVPTPVLPLGIADLLLVRNHVSGYERSEVAAIENVLPHENLTHVVRRLDTTETTTTTETERTDLRTLTQTTADESSGRPTVHAVGPGLGPVTDEQSTSFAKAVTDQVSSTSTSRTRRQLVERRLRETEESTTHLIENSTGDPVCGVYQWLDKICEARTFTYGSRLLYDVIVPEPAAMFREALSRPRSGLPLPVRPAPFTLKPDRLTSDNWGYYSAGHHAAGVEAPPPAEIVVSEPFFKPTADKFAGGAMSNTLTFAEARVTRIPKGYRASSCSVVVMYTGCAMVHALVSIGTKTFSVGANDKAVWTGRLDGERETIPVAVDVFLDGVDDVVPRITITVEIICKATDELMGAWQVKTHAQILAANRRRFEEYAEAMATRDATARLTLQAMPPARKATIVPTEVKRATLAYLTGQSFSGFNATALDTAGFPYPQAAATGALAAYIRFLEQAIEWDHLAYAFLPYFWGAQTSWVAKLISTESDRTFADFLTSGAGRVVLPVRSGYEKAFERFLKKGVVPTTDEMLDVGGPLWASLVDQLRMQSSPEGEEAAVGEPWEFRIATDLVRARADGSMPRWTFNGGAWADFADPSF